MHGSLPRTAYKSACLLGIFARVADERRAVVYKTQSSGCFAANEGADGVHRIVTGMPAYYAAWEYFTGLGGAGGRATFKVSTGGYAANNATISPFFYGARALLEVH
jgi:hypothetical protein